MFRNYPLTTLFIIATVCVDVVVVLTSEGNNELDINSGFRFYLWNFGIPAQVGALALWAIFGGSHRLTKGAFITFLGGAILLLHWVLLPEMFLNEHTFINLLQMLIAMGGAALLRLCGIGKPEKISAQSFRFSLMEIFGWTMIVALWAFAFRSAAARIPVDKYFMIWLLAASAGPLLVAPALFSKLSALMRLTALIMAYLIAFVIYAIASYYLPDEPIVNWAFGMAIAQITYIAAWWAVMRMDEGMQRRREMTNPSREKLTLFDPE